MAYKRKHDQASSPHKHWHSTCLVDASQSPCNGPLSLTQHRHQSIRYAFVDTGIPTGSNVTCLHTTMHLALTNPFSQDFAQFRAPTGSERTAQRHVVVWPLQRFSRYFGASGGRLIRSVSNNSMNCSFCTRTWQARCRLTQWSRRFSVSSYKRTWTS